MSLDGIRDTNSKEEAPQGNGSVENGGAVESAPVAKPSDTDAETSGNAQESEYDKRKRRRVHNAGEAVFCRPLEVVVRDDKVEQAIRQLKNRMAREGVLRELKNRRHYFKPSELKRIKSREAARRRRKQARQKGSN